MRPTRLSVVIPSKTARNFLACAGAVRKHESAVRVIVVDDGIEPGTLWKDEGPGGNLLVSGIKPFIFSRNVNLGIRAAGHDDVVLLNDDAILQTPGGFSLMQKTAEDHPDFGVIAATTNRVGNKNQYRIAHDGLREDPRSLCFICVLIPRSTIEKVGLLDEDYNCYSHQDDDYCYRVRRAGLRLGICDGCFVDHASLPSSFRDGPNAPGGELRTGERIFIEKWGAYPL